MFIPSTYGRNLFRKQAFKHFNVFANVPAVPLRPWPLSIVESIKWLLLEVN